MSETPDLATNPTDPQAIVEEHLTPRLVTCVTTHYFVYQSTGEIKCRNCPLGYLPSVGTTLKDGHIYLKGVLAL